MKAKGIRYHFQEVGTWVDWRRTCDQFLHGDADADVKGIATAWIPTNEAIRDAATRGLNLFITHEHVFPDQYAGNACADRLIREKKKLLNENDMTVMRCHDTWDRMPGYGIPDAWAEFLGFKTEDRPTHSFYKVCVPGTMSVQEVGERIREKVKALGQDTVLVFGDRKKTVKRLAVGTGAITHFPTMYRLGVDAIVATDDGFNSTNGGLWSVDLDIPVFVVNHATAEKPGMQAMSRYLKEQFPDIPVEYVDVRFPYSAIQ